MNIIDASNESGEADYTTQVRQIFSVSLVRIFRKNKEINLP